jgi:hypothetical protein
MIGLIALKAAGAFHGGSEVSGISLVDDDDGGWRQIEMSTAERLGGGERDAEQQQGIAQNGRHCGSGRRNRRNLPWFRFYFDESKWFEPRCKRNGRISYRCDIFSSKSINTGDFLALALREPARIRCVGAHLLSSAAR